jgi:hypothetical protein
MNGYVPNPGWETSETGWLGIGTTEVTFTAATTGNPDMLALLHGPQPPAQTRPVQIDYRVPVKLRWWRRMRLRVRRKPVPTIQRQVIIPNASVTVTDPAEGQQ